MSSDSVLIYAIRGTVDWWKYVARNMDFDHATVVSDVKSNADITTTKSFYSWLSKYRDSGEACSDLISQQVATDIIQRCRVLRGMDESVACAMVLAMAETFNEILARTRPSAILSFPIDRYVSDVLQRLSQDREIPYFEFAVSPLPGSAMLMSRGRLLCRDEDADEEKALSFLNEIRSEKFSPSYVASTNRFSTVSWIKVFFYFRLRALVFKAISVFENDPYSLHYLDAQNWLPHKANFLDISIIGLQQWDWRESLESFPLEKRVAVGLTVFPEASIDYWIDDIELIDYERNLTRLVTELSRRDYLVLVKDHPQQFGFRKAGLIKDLLKLSNVRFVPYAVSGNELLSSVGVNLTFTGTMGLQAKLMGLSSVVVKNYYSNSTDFIEIQSSMDLDGIVKKLETRADQNVDAQQNNLEVVRDLMRGSFEVDFFSFINFDQQNPAPSISYLSNRLASEIRNHMRCPP